MQVYKQVPMWWFYVILVVNIVVIIFACEYYNYILQLRWWGVLLACAIAILYTLPIGIITATTNQVKLIKAHIQIEIAIADSICLCDGGCSAI